MSKPVNPCCPQRGFTSSSCNQKEDMICRGVRQFAPDCISDGRCRPALPSMWVYTPPCGQGRITDEDRRARKPRPYQKSNQTVGEGLVEFCEIPLLRGPLPQATTRFDRLPSGLSLRVEDTVLSKVEGRVAPTRD